MLDITLPTNWIQLSEDEQHFMITLKETKRTKLQPRGLQGGHHYQGPHQHHWGKGVAAVGEGGQALRAQWA